MGKVSLRFNRDLGDKEESAMPRSGDRTLQAQGRRRRLDPEAGGGVLKGSATKGKVFFCFPSFD